MSGGHMKAANESARAGKSVVAGGAENEEWIGNYKVVGELGSGAMGFAVLAIHPVLDRLVVIKRPHAGLSGDPSVLTRFANEARAANAARHPHVVEVLDYGHQPDGTPYFVMEYLDGQPLSALMAKEGTLPPGRTVEIMCQVAAAVERMHAAGIVHRDLKPENIYLVKGGDGPPGAETVKVIDFGIARLQQLPSGTTRTLAGVLMGTSLYMSPEQVTGSVEIDARSDIYSMGVILFEMIAGRPPFNDVSPTAVMVKHLSAEPPRLRDLVLSVPAAIDAIVHRALAKAPGDRQPSASELRRELEAVRGQLGAGERRRPTLSGVTAAIVAAAATVFTGVAVLPSRAPAGQAISASPASSARPERPRSVDRASSRRLSTPHRAGQPALP